jgi:hypothetical protein
MCERACANASCGALHCASECTACGLPYCSEKCRLGHADHDEACKILKDATLMHDGTYVGIDISTQNKERMWDRPIPADFFGAATVGNLVEPTKVLARIKADAAKATPPYDVNFYAGHIDEVGTGTRAFSWLSAHVAPVHVGTHGGAAAVYLISTGKHSKSLKDFAANWNTGSAQDKANRFGAAIIWLRDHQKAFKIMIDREGKRAGKKI